MNLADILIFALALVLSAGSPGPSVATLVARVISSGPRSVYPLLAGMWIGEMSWLLAAIFGLGFIAQQLQGLLTVIKYLGVV